MNLQIIDKKENPLLGRTEVRFLISHPNEPTPAREKMRNLLANNFQVSVNNVIINYAKTQYGLSYTIGYGKIYSTEDFVKKVELPHILKRNGLLEDEKKKE